MTVLVPDKMIDYFGLWENNWTHVTNNLLILLGRLKLIDPHRIIFQLAIFKAFLFQICQQDSGDLHDRVLRRQRGLQVLGPVHQPSVAGQDSPQARWIYTGPGNFALSYSVGLNPVVNN